MPAKKKKTNLFTPIAFFVLLGLLLFVLFHKPSEKVRGPEKPKIAVPIKARLAIVIDDMGYREDVIETLMSLKRQITFSFLPGLKYTKKMATKVHESGYEVLAHMPMEPLNYPKFDPGKIAVFDKMSDKDIKKVVREIFQSVPYADGMNNHMGSLATADPRVMKAMLEEVKAMNVFYVDSVTTPATVGYKIAKEMGVPTGKRNVFLDDQKSVENTRKYFRQVADIALKQGYAIAIGHPYENTLNVMKEELPKFEAEGIILVPVSQIVKNDAPAGH
jgi:uncharacterized protein